MMNIYIPATKLGHHDGTSTEFQAIVPVGPYNTGPFPPAFLTIAEAGEYGFNKLGHQLERYTELGVRLHIAEIELKGENEITRLRDKLKTAVRLLETHGAECDNTCEGHLDSDRPCTCGFRQSMQELRKAIQ